MSTNSGAGGTAGRVADHLRSSLPGEWEVYGERLVHHEIHLSGSRIELVRGPIEVEGYAVRLFRPRESVVGVGFCASNDLSPAGIESTAAAAEQNAPLASFPAPRADLPAPGPVGGHAPELIDPAIRDRPREAIREFAEAILAEFPSDPRVVPSFGSVRVTFTERSVANSTGLARTELGTTADFEWAVKATGGPEGAPPGEYWVNSAARRLDRTELGIDVPRWIRLAQDVRRAKPPSSGALNVLFPAAGLHDIVPPVLGFRLSGSAVLRKMAPELGSAIAAPSVTIADDPQVPFGLGSGRFDDEGRPTRPTVAVESGLVRTRFYDALHAAGLEATAEGHARRSGGLGESWHHFTNTVAPGPTNLDVRPGGGGSDAELIEAAGDGIWLEQLGDAFPDPLAGAYGGEIRLAYRIRNGKLAEPLRGGTVGGLVLAPPGEPSLLANVRGIGGEPRLVGAFRSPTLWVGGIAVAGPQ